MEEAKVSDLMSTKLTTITPKDSVAAAFELMDQKGIRHLPAVDGGELVGLITHRDLLAQALYTGESEGIRGDDKSFNTYRVKDAMTRTPETVTSDMNVTEAGRLMLENKFGCLPVVDGQTLVGILTESDFIKQIVQEYEGA